MSYLVLRTYTDMIELRVSEGEDAALSKTPATELITCGMFGGDALFTACTSKHSPQVEVEQGLTSHQTRCHIEDGFLQVK